MTNEGGFDLGSLLEQAQAMQQQMMAAQAEQAKTIVTGSSGGGKVTIESSGDGVFRNVTIAPDAVDPDDVEMLEELVLAALRDVASQVSELQNSAFGDLPIDMDNMGDLGGLLGGGSEQ